MRYIKSFGHFWVDFLVGDCPELAWGSLLILGIAFALHASEIVAAFIVPLAVILLLVFSLRHMGAK